METSSSRYNNLEDIKDFMREISGHSSTLNSISSELIKLLERRKRKGNPPFIFKGVDAFDLVKLDFWEEEYMKKVEVRVEIVEKFNKKKSVNRNGKFAY